MDSYVEMSYLNKHFSFPQKLYHLLETDSGELLEWAPNGMCFRIKNIDRFSTEIIPKYFKQSKMTSFQRQLNLYGFRRISKGEDAGCYFHPLFQRDKKHLLPEIKRLPPKGSLPTYDQVKYGNSNYPINLGDRKRRLKSKQALSLEDKFENKRPRINNLTDSQQYSPKSIVDNIHLDDQNENIDDSNYIYHEPLLMNYYDNGHTLPTYLNTESMVTPEHEQPSPMLSPDDVELFQFLDSIDFEDSTTGEDSTTAALDEDDYLLHSPSDNDSRHSQHSEDHHLFKESFNNYYANSRNSNNHKHYIPTFEEAVGKQIFH